MRLRPHGLPGRLVIIDGNDGTGKSTLLGGIEQRLRERGYDVLRTSQPTTEARELDAFKVYLFEPERRDEIDYRALLCMMIGDRLQHAHQIIKPALAAGQIVLCDRYIFTQMVTTRTRGYQDEPWMYELYQHVIRSRVRSARSRVYPRSARTGAGGTNDGRSMPFSVSLASHTASSLSVFDRPGTFLTSRALTRCTDSPAASSR